MKTYKWTVTFEIDETWVADGFEMTDERAHEIIWNALPYATGDELQAKVIKAPSQAAIKKAQGYETA